MKSYIYSVTEKEFFEFAGFLFYPFPKCVLLLQYPSSQNRTQVLFQTIYFLASAVGDLINAQTSQILVYNVLL